MFKKIIAGLMLACGAASSGAIELAGLQNAHDPGTITKDGDTYFNFTTGTGIWYSTSTDLKTWQGGPAPVFATNPAWVEKKIPNFKANGSSYWAPDVIQMNGAYYIYYSVSQWGTTNSAIGVARSPSLKNPVWTDLGVVVQSYNKGNTEINAIDPALFRDHDGRVYMSFGSFFGGLGVGEIDQATGKLASYVTKIAGGTNARRDIEAPYITRNGDYYYLFANRGACCQGSNSTYYVEVQRATSVDGPYSEPRTILANIDGRHKGPGHVGVLKQNGCNFVSTHYYDTADNGNAKLQIMKMTYATRGTDIDWPVLTRDFDSFTDDCDGVSDGRYAILNQNSGKALTVADTAMLRATQPGAMVQQKTFGALKNQYWYVIGHGNGDYSVINENSLLGMDDWEVSMSPGAKVAQWSYWGGDGQKWQFADAASGNYTIKNKLNGLVAEVSGGSTANNAAVLQYPLHGGASQQWSLVRQ